MSLRDDHDNSYKLTADYRLRAVMKLQFFVLYKLDSNAWWFTFRGMIFRRYWLVASISAPPKASENFFFFVLHTVQKGDNLRNSLNINW